MTTDILKRNISTIRDNIEKACSCAGRHSSEITAVAVTKTVDTDTVKQLCELGIKDFGENRTSEILRKEDFCSQCGYEDLNWHLIGHLQTNKVNKLKGRKAFIHSVDSTELMKKLNTRAEEDGEKRDILLQFNVSKEESKHGFYVEDTQKILEHCTQMNYLNICGLMTMAPLAASEAEIHKVFGETYKLFVDIQAKKIDNINMYVLSMGMSNDYMIAIAEGATHLRIGRGFFAE